jgi:phytoene dehydrogenase-like protein
VTDHDVLIIGAGHNGLTAATVLAQHGLDVLVLEKTNFPGGMAATRELFPGYKHSIGAWTFIVYADEMLDRLELTSRWGFELIDQWASFCTFGEPGDPPFIAFNDLDRMTRHIADDHGADALEGLMGLYTHLSLFQPHFEEARFGTPRPINQILAEAPDAATRADMTELWYGSCMDVVRRFFPDPTRHRTIGGSFSAMTIDSTFRGPFSPGTGASMLYHYLAGGMKNVFRMPKGGIGTLSEALARAVEGHQAEIAYKSVVDHLLVEGGRVVGVALRNGETVTARAVISTLDARTTFIDLLGREHLPAQFAHEINEIDYANGYVQVHMTLDGEPTWADHLAPWTDEEHVTSTMSYIPSAEYLSAAWEQYRRGRMPDEPVAYLYIPSLVDPAMAPPGKHSATIFAPYFPHDLAPADHKVMKEQFADRLIDKLGEQAPDLKDLVQDRVVFTNQYFANTFGITGGDFAHGLLHPGQMWERRPAPGWTQHATPVPQLYLGGSACHPGPGVTSIPGWRSAHVVLDALGAPAG